MNSPELGVELWDFEKYCSPDAVEALPLVTPFAQVTCQVARGSINSIDPPLWITTTMERVSPFVNVYFVLQIVTCVH